MYDVKVGPTKPDPTIKKADKAKLDAQVAEATRFDREQRKAEAAARARAAQADRDRPLAAKSGSPEWRRSVASK